jgi:hypothetical protein
MTGLEKQVSPSQLTPAGEAEAIRYLKQAIASGKHWYIALLEAVGLWSAAEEVNNGRVYRYLINGEAFDWLLLAERLCESVDGLLPEDKKLGLLFHGKPPLNLTTEEFKQLIGNAKYHQYLNYFYGIMVEEALIMAVREEARKERRTSGYHKELDIDSEVYQRIYGVTKTALLKRFRREKKYPQRRSISLTELKEFTYWLFKYRLNHCDKAKVASDTKKGLEYLRQQGTNNSPAGKLETEKLIPA